MNRLSTIQMALFLLISVSSFCPAANADFRSAEDVIGYSETDEARCLNAADLNVLPASDDKIAWYENQYQNETPVADAGLSRYVATDPIQLDGTNSYDPDESGPLGFAWQQVSGPVVEIGKADTASPTVSGFIQTDEIQECEFELVVSNGESTSLPDTVKVIIVPDFGDSTLELENPPFDPGKPTVMFFGGGDATSGDVISGINGHPGRRWNNDAWNSRVNVISFPSGYYPDDRHYEPWATYYRYGDLMIVYLSSVAPNYRQPIQVMGFSAGGMPTLDVGIRLNSYRDPRYAVHHVTPIDAATRAQPEFGGSWDLYLQGVELFLNSSVDGEPCWLDFYYGSIGWPYEPFPPTDFLRIRSALGHGPVRDWYRDSITSSDMSQFNSGVVAGAYWSVAGPGKNLRLARSDAYYFQWNGGVHSGSMNFYDETQFPGRLPEPVTLVGPADGATVDASGALLSCEESENAVGYRLLFGADPRHMVYLCSDTPEPPDAVLSTFPFRETWWTVQAYDQYGSAIHADPICIHTDSAEPQKVENLAMGRTYASIQQALNDAHPGDEIVIDAGVYHYRENLDFKGKNLTLRSTDPDDPDVVAATVISGCPGRAAITISGSSQGSTVVAGLTITGGEVGISCGPASPTIRNCTIGGDCPTAVRFWQGYEPTIIDSTVLGAVEPVEDPTLIAHWALDETEGDVASDSIGDNDGTVHGDPDWKPEGGMVNGALEFDGVDDHVVTDGVLDPADGPFSVLAWINGGAPGQVIVSQVDGVNWLMIDASEGTLATELIPPMRRTPVPPLVSDVVVTDGLWHRIAFVWDGVSRSLYVDEMLVAQDEQGSLNENRGDLHIGCGKGKVPGTFFSGLIDDVRIYNRAITP